jgi:hypothetical protein
VIPSPNDLRGLQDIIQLCHLSDTAALTAISLLPVLVHLVGTPVILVNLETEFTDTQHNLKEVSARRNTLPGTASYLLAM